MPLSRNLSADYYDSRLRSQSRKKIAHATLLAIIAALVCTTVAVAAFVSDINSKITGKVDENLKTALTTQEAGKPFYLLLIGVDKDEGRANDPQYGASDSGYRSDSIMLTRIDPGEKKVTMVSIHRDTLVDLGEHGQQKINAAYAIGQEAYTTKVISEFADVPISHYAEVDMDGLAAVIDSIGGIDIHLDMDVKDPNYTGIDLEKGDHHLDGETAALFSRCRHAYDAYGDGDRYRAANQRLVISTVAKKILQSDPATIASTVQKASEFIRTDMDVSFLVSLATQFIGMDTENDIYSGMEPTTARYINNTWYELCDTAAWRKMMRRVDKGLPPTEKGDVDALETSPDSGEQVTINQNTNTNAPTYYDDSPSSNDVAYPYYYEEPVYSGTVEEEPVYTPQQSEEAPAAPVATETTEVEPTVDTTQVEETAAAEAAAAPPDESLV